MSNITNSNNNVNNLFESVFGAELVEAPARRMEVKPLRIQHLETDLKKTEPVVVGEDENHEPTSWEQRYCLGSTIEGLKMTAFKITVKEPKLSDVHTFLIKDLYYAYGGTGLNKGEMYGVHNMPIEFTKASEPIASLSLLATPAACDAYGNPFMYECKVLIIADQEMRKAGLPEGNTGIIMDTTIRPQGQFRALINGTSLAKGAAFYKTALADAGIKIKNEWNTYDVILSEDHIKVNKLMPGSYNCVFLITYDNANTIEGHVGHSFEYYQFIKFNKKYCNMIIGNLPKTDYNAVMFGGIRNRVIAAAKDGNQYTQTNVETAMQNGYATFGKDYPVVNEHLQKQMLRWLINSRVPESSMKLVVVVCDDNPNAIRISKTPNAQLYKFPITAGIAKVHVPEKTKEMQFFPIAESTCLKINTDGDGDIANLNMGPISDYALQHNLIKPLRDINVQGRSKWDFSFSIGNLSKIITKILDNNGKIGQLTMAYYRAEIEKELNNSSIDLSPYFRGIEAVIKSNKWDMEEHLQVLKNRDFELEKDLRTKITDIWREKYWESELNSLFEKSETDEKTIDKVKSFVVKYSIASPLHYMDHIWNAVLGRSITEIQVLMNSKKHLSYFERFVDPQIKMDEKKHDKDIALLEKLNKMFGASFDKTSKLNGKSNHIIELIKTVSEGIEASAGSDFLIKFLKNSKGSGMFPLYWINLGRIIEGRYFQAHLNTSKYVAATKEIFGSNCDASVENVAKKIMQSGDIQLKIWRSRPKGEKTGFSIKADEFTVGEKLIVVDGSIDCNGKKASINGNCENGKYEIIKVVSVYNANGAILETGIMLTVKGAE